MPAAEKPYDFLPPGGQFQRLIGTRYITSTMFTPDRMVQFYSTDGELTTITVPHEQYCGPLWIKAVTEFKWTTAGNIYVPPLTTCVVGYCYGFVYDELVTKKWYPIGAVNV